MDALLARLRSFASDTYTPILRADTEEKLREILSARRPCRILEIGAAIGYSAAVMLSTLPQALLTTLEIRHCRYAQALENLTRAGVAERATVLCEDATAYFDRSSERFDFVFLDGPKAQYAKLLPRISSALDRGGAIFADNLEFGGRVAAVRRGGTAAIPRKHRAAVKGLIDYCDALRANGFRTEFYEIGDGIALSEKV